MRSLLSGYLLSSQGDRVTAANSVEGRYPFLDNNLIEFAAKIPPYLKILGLNEKFILKKSMAKELPQNIINRVKQPYMAPDSNCFCQTDSPEYVEELLSPSCLARQKIFNPTSVVKLREKCSRFSDGQLSFKDNMSFIGILSTQMLIHKFLDEFAVPPPLAKSDFTVWVDQFSGQR
jgi:asparagine synthase (glutamine-hydrolysing)